MTSIIKVDNIQDVCGSATLTKCGTTITIGASGDTIALAAGASQTGFGQTYSAVSWDTTPKTTTVTAASGIGYFVDTTLGAITVNLPAGVAGSIVSVSDYANTAATNNITITANGTDKINGLAYSYKIATNGVAITLIYVDSTIGWKDINDATLDVTGISPFIIATGGTITCDGDYKIHSFTGPGTFTVSSAGTPAGSTTVDYMVVAGGGGGASTDYTGGGGGAGGFRESVPSPAVWTASPLANPGGALPVSVQGYPITVGAGGSVGGNTNGSDSIFNTITSAGGGFGAGGSPTVGGSGGAGGGGRSIMCGGFSAGGSGNTPPVSPSQGNNGGSGPGNGRFVGGGGGGGATSAGTAGSIPTAGPGGAGATTSISGSPTSYTGGGGGGSNAGVDGGTETTGGDGGLGGGGRGGARGCGPGTPKAASRTSTAGTANTGGGGGGRGGDSNTGAAGGSGVVIIRYKFQ
tara:strand:+ start:945 stop:2336 length:1392 start_codon:yes stop_codon:yes gene_type:complete